MAGNASTTKGHPMPNESKYTPEMRRWLADELSVRPAREVIGDFARRFKMPTFNRNALATLRSDVGGHKKFIEKYKTKPFGLSTAENLLVATILLQWQPRAGKDPFVVAAREVNKQRGVGSGGNTVNRDGIEEMVVKAGGVANYLLSVKDGTRGSNPAAAAKRAEATIGALFYQK